MPVGGNLLIAPITISRILVFFIFFFFSIILILFNRTNLGNAISSIVCSILSYNCAARICISPFCAQQQPVLHSDNTFNVLSARALARSHHSRR